MTTIACCGHDIDNKEYISFEMMDFTTDYYKQEIVRAVNFGVYCKECANEYESFGVVLHTLKEKEDWLSEKTNYPVVEELDA